VVLCQPGDVVAVAAGESADEEMMFQRLVGGQIAGCESLAVECLPGLARMIVPNWLDESKVARRV